jgi:hypothetical protein
MLIPWGVLAADSNIHAAFPHLLPAQLGATMSHLMKLAEALRDIAEERSETEIEQALDLCTGFADRVRREPEDAANCREF